MGIIKFNKKEKNMFASSRRGMQVFN